MTQSFDFTATAAVTTTDERDIYTPTRLNGEARVLLERGFGSLWLEGELSNFSRPGSGHWYFSLKDSDAQLRCAMFRQKNMLTNFAPKDGLHVLLRGKVSVYEPRGDYQFIAEYMEEAGEGALRRQFEQLKIKLAAAGLFASERKRALPALPRRIGVITSPTGAAIRDILHVLKRRFPSIPVLIYPVAVQGKDAAGQIANAIQLADRRQDCDVLIVARGGGSLEDLWSFNEEVVAHAIFNCSIPLISGVGHEIDFTIADFVADVRAPTPSAAAELVVPDRQAWLHNLRVMQQHLFNGLQRKLNDLKSSFNWLTQRLQQLHPGIQLRQRAQRVDELEQRLIRAWQFDVEQRKRLLGMRQAKLNGHSPLMLLSQARNRLQQARSQIASYIKAQQQTARSRFDMATRTLNTLSPLATLNRGYAITTGSDAKVITDATAVKVGDTIITRLAKGKLIATVNEIDNQT
ncbi:MAG TPA: exodeoxyribonuclease VII large subunit [Steroidobacteraceae bacterium]|nr:exodeoxyribonuclease VII large subunit [Steroidobacteraceae bacterium]